MPEGWQREQGREGEREGGRGRETEGGGGRDWDRWVRGGAWGGAWGCVGGEFYIYNQPIYIYIHIYNQLGDVWQLGDDVLAVEQHRHARPRPALGPPRIVPARLSFYLRPLSLSLALSPSLSPSPSPSLPLQ